MSTKKILSCLVSYHATAKLTQALQLQSRMVVPPGYSLQLMVFDNSETPAIVPGLQDLCRQYSAELVVLQQNQGVSGAYAEACKILLRDSFDYIWLWDQDSQPPTDCLQTLLRTFEDEDNKARKYLTLSEGRYKLRPLGVVLPRLFDPTLVDQHWIFHGPPYDLSKMRSFRFPMDWIERGEVATTFMVNSGALVSRQLIEAVGSPDPNFFMDLVDFEFSSRITRANFRMVVNADTTVLHSVGEPAKFKLLGRTIWARNYPAFRYYYQAKNEILLAYASGQVFKIGMSANFRLFLRPIKICFDRSNTLKKILAHYMGWLDGWRKVQGRSHAAWMTKTK